MGQPWQAILDVSDPVEQAVAMEVFQEAEKLRVKRQAHFFDQMEIVITNSIVKAFKR